jgi:2-haloacid dehalogenase
MVGPVTLHALEAAVRSSWGPDVCEDPADLPRWSLAEAGFRVITLSHGSPGVAEAGLERGGIAPLVERSLSSEIRAWKPSREAYLWAAGSCRVAPDRMALVASHGWDVLGAQRAGLTGAWFPRSERSYPAVYEPPHITASDLSGVVDALLALSPA